MYQAKSIAVVIPAYNEATQLKKTVASVPDCVDCVVIVNDASTDATADVAQSLGAVEVLVEERSDGPLVRNGAPKLFLISHERNNGCGAAVTTGYRWCRTNRMDVAVVMDGDGQMNGEDLIEVITPVVTDKADYCKGNRLFTEETYRVMPKVRLFGNNTLSLLTKIASGYWHIADSQSGFAAISLDTLDKLSLRRLYGTYGYLNHLLVLLNVVNSRVVNVPVKAIYNQGEHSKLKISRAIPRISLLMTRLFFWRLREKYVIRDFHPLVFFYILAMFLGITGIGLGGRLVWLWVEKGYVPPMTALALGFCMVTGLQSAFFAMWFDMEYNKHLR